MKIILDLDESEVEVLLEQFLLPNEGPVGAGWRSDEVLELEEKISESIEAAQDTEAM